MNDIESYKKVIKILEKNPNIFGAARSMILSVAEGCIYANELKEKYGFDIDITKPVDKDWHNFNGHACIGFFDGERRKISWPDDGRQPKNEILLRIEFPTGAYVFGSYTDEDYPIEIFQSFFNELKNFNPKYIDFANKNLYYTLENAGRVFNELPNILERYRKISNADFKKRKAERLRKEAESLENEI